MRTVLAVGPGTRLDAPALGRQTMLPDILLDDEFLVAFDKPSGMPVASDRWEKSGTTLLDLVREHIGGHVANVHRLDADASGVVLFAKTKEALDFLSGQFQSKTVVRIHAALVALPPREQPPGTHAPARNAAGALPSEFSVDLALGPDDDHPGRTRVFRRRGGRPSLTQFRLVEDFGAFARLECRPLTGRAHQVRVHLAAAGAPVLNDALYGDPARVLLLSGLKRRYKGREAEKPLISRLALHASALEFVHPSSRLPMGITAPMPREFEIALKYLRKFPGAGPRRPS